MVNKKCYLLRGFPGSGKSSLVKKILHDNNISYDHVFSTDSLFIPVTNELIKINISKTDLSDLISICEKIRKILSTYVQIDTNKEECEKIYIKYIQLFNSGDYVKAIEFAKTNQSKIEYLEYRNNWNFSFSSINHKKNQNNFFTAVDSGMTPVIVDNTNVAVKEGAVYVQYAHKHGYEIIIQEPNSPHWNEYKQYLNNRYLNKNKIAEFADVLYGKNTHGVPKDTILKMIDRWALNPSVNDYLNYGKQND